MLDGFLFSLSVKTKQLGFRSIEHDFSNLNDLLNSLNSCKTRVYILSLVLNRVVKLMEAVVLHRVGFLAYSCPKQGQDFKPSAAPLYPNMGQVPPPRVPVFLQITRFDIYCTFFADFGYYG